MITIDDVLSRLFSTYPDKTLSTINNLLRPYVKSETIENQRV